MSAFYRIKHAATTTTPSMNSNNTKAPFNPGGYFTKAEIKILKRSEREIGPVVCQCDNAAPWCCHH